MEKVEDAPEVGSLYVRLPISIHNLLQELAVFHDESLEESIRNILMIEVDKELDGAGALGGDLAKFLCKKYHYKPFAWRKEVS
jgi:hypothetical protein